MDYLMRSAEIMAESIVKLSEESREVLSGLTETNESIQRQLSAAGNEYQKITAELVNTMKQMQSSVSDSEKRLGHMMKGILLRTWLLVIFTGIVSGGLTGWLTWRWSSQRQAEQESAYRAGMKAIIEEMSQQYTITRKTTPPKPSAPRSGPSEGTGSK